MVHMSDVSPCSSSNLTPEHCLDASVCVSGTSSAMFLRNYSLLCHPTQNTTFPQVLKIAVR
ncbi:hypothetical protein E2C01_012998 [Portunus trituberculatus]|uniref:Uncharacterized protein n=1 Tax=Portunus trituberculatus TaxID=210409 RepID=A0A5B7DFH5_PORTR|nr:hypothetical protein [Portunus trituberculatus]